MPNIAMPNFPIYTPHLFSVFRNILLLLTLVLSHNHLAVYEKSKQVKNSTKGIFIY